MMCLGSGIVISAYHGCIVYALQQPCLLARGLNMFVHAPEKRKIYSKRARGEKWPG
jgi:hypothetical protein